MSDPKTTAHLSVDNNGEPDGGLVTFDLYRLTAHPAMPLYERTSPERMARGTIVRESILTAQPQVLRGKLWWISHIETIGAYGLYFRFGRGVNKAIPLPGKNREFSDKLVELTPFSHVVFDAQAEICAISRRYDLSTSTAAIGRSLVLVLNQSSFAKGVDYGFAISAVKESGQFLQRLRNAYTVTQLWVTTPRPNPFDAEEDFQKPTSRLLEAVHGDLVKTTITGRHLDVTDEGVERIIEGAARTGADAGARVKDSHASKSEIVKLGDTKRSMQADPAVDKATLLDQVLDVVDTVTKRLLRR